MPESKWGKNIVSELQVPESKKVIENDYAKYAKRILWLDKDVVPGAFHMNTAWYMKAAEALENVPHTHEADEIIGFFSNNPDDPYDLGGEVEIWIEDEKHILTKSCYVFVPAGVPHCPLILRRVDRPIFHFTIVPSKQYIKDDK